jgi:hypothetical protein
MKVNRTLALALAAHLFELEIESIGNDPEFHFEFNGWLDKYGDVSLKHQDQLTSSPENQFNAAAIEMIADEVQKDFESGYWSIGSCESNLYNYMMPTQYGGYITKALGQQLAMLTGAGVQEELFTEK